MENSQGNWVKPPRSSTTDGTAVARIVASMATNDVDSITASSTGPRSERRPTAERATRSGGTEDDNRNELRVIPAAAQLLAVSASRAEPESSCLGTKPRTWASVR